MNCTKRWATILSLCSALCVAAPASADEPAPQTGQGCDSFTWNLAREFAALKKPAMLLAASADPKVNPVRLEESQHVTATLVPQGSVSFAAPPARQRKSENATAGLLFFKTGGAGRYRISLTSRHWIDVLDGRKAIDSVAHEGRGGCELLHKVVEFELPANRDLVLQLSGDDAATVDVVVTKVAHE
ncbi:MAG: hypothetical protein WDO72_07645 [Pseudomonadota bacterium]